MDSVDAALPITVTLKAAEWNQVVGLCAEGAWQIADPLIKAITQQIFAAASAAQAAPARPASNGSAEGVGHVSD